MTKKTDKKTDKKTTAKEETIITLDATEKKALTNAESTIRNGLKAFFNVGKALAAIRTGRLYRAGFSTFDKYAAEKWDMTRARVSQLIASYRIHDMLKLAGFATLPTTESQCRPFSKVPEDGLYDVNIKRIWDAVLTQARDLKVALTAKLVDEMTNKVLCIETKTPENKQATGDSDGRSAGATGSEECDNASETARAEVRELKAKIAFLESALAAEKQAHKRTRTAGGSAMPKTALATDLLKAGFRAMAKKHHPDHGGSADTMRELNGLKQEMGI